MHPDLGPVVRDRLGPTSGLVRALRPAYALWLRAAYGRRGLPWHFNGEAIRIDPGIRRFVPQTAERPLFEYLRAAVRPGDVVLDIGAFVGAYAIMEARWVGEQGRVVAFEPSPESFALLQRHLRMNGLTAPRVEARCLALGAVAERRGLKTFDGEPYRNMITVTEDAQTVVDVTTVDDMCRTLERPPNWIRMDVQGLEFEVLRGARDLLRERRGRLKIVAEMHPQHWPAYGIEPRKAGELLAELGLRARSVVPGEDPFGYDAHAILEPLA